MRNLRHTVLLAVLAAALLCCPAAALEVTADPTAAFTFSADDFTSREADEGIFLTAVPKAGIAELCLGNRVLQAGDALSRDALNQLHLQTACVTQQDVSVEYCTIADGAVSGNDVLKLSILPKKNDPPTTADSQLETYKNIAVDGELQADDPENGALTYTLVDSPKRGTVELHEDGSFTYTPDHNKVGKDSFTYLVTDDAGNTSQPAKVTIQIKKPTDKATYADMAGDPDAFAAMWMKEEDLFSGTTIGGHLCFSPDESLSRGEFLVMVMKLVDAEVDDTQLTSGFADEAQTPRWLQPYLTTALRNGMITGISVSDGVAFQAASAMTKAEAAVMLQNILQLPLSETQAVFSSDTETAIPVWAAESAAALAQAGIDLDILQASDPLTRRDAARILYRVGQLIEEKAVSTFYWVQ